MYLQGLLDLRKAFWQIEICDQSKLIWAFEGIGVIVLFNYSFFFFFFFPNNNRVLRGGKKGRYDKLKSYTIN